MACRGVSTKAMNRRRNSLILNRIRVVSGCPGSFGGGGHGEEGTGEHDQDGPAVPGGPRANLMLIPPGQVFAELKRFLNGAASPGDPSRLGQGDLMVLVAAVIGQFTRCRRHA